MPDESPDELRLNILFSAIAEAERYSFDRDVVSDLKITQRIRLSNSLGSGPIKLIAEGGLG